MIDKDKVIQLAKEAGFGSYAHEAQSIFERFAQAIYRQGLEDAAAEANRFLTSGRSPHGLRVADAIRSLKESTNG
jgi:hypothetical protein